MPFALIGLINEYQRERIATFLDPAKDPLGSGFNTLQAEIGIGSGGLFGKGLTHGTQTQLDYSEDADDGLHLQRAGGGVGLCGGGCPLRFVCAAAVAGAADGHELPRSVRAADWRRAIVTFILFQVFINIGVNIRLLPVTGIPLPFISQGGAR